MKSQGSSKLGYHCTAQLSATVDNTSGKVVVKPWLTHYGHSDNLAYIRLPNSDRQKIASRFKDGVTFDRIIDDIWCNISSRVDCVHLITKKDVRNIQRSFGIQEKQKIKRATLVSSWLKKKFKMPRKDYGIFTRIHIYGKYCYWYMFFPAILHMLCDKTTMSKLEKHGQIIDQADIKLGSEQLPDEVLDLDLDGSHLGKYFTLQGWHHLLQLGIKQFYCICNWNTADKAVSDQFKQRENTRSVGIVQ